MRVAFLTLVQIITAACAFAAPALADDDDYPVWKPSNDTATAITGPIVLLPERLKVGPVYLPWRLDSLAPQFKPEQGSMPARIFEVIDKTSTPELLNGRTLCGAKPANWIIMIPAPPNGLEIDVYSGADKPASISSPGLCNTFTYNRW